MQRHNQNNSAVLANQILISKDAVADNYKYFSQLIKPANLMAIIKADGYGLGLSTIYEAIKQLNIKFLGINNLDEGIILKKLGFNQDILVLGPCFKEELDDFSNHNLTVSMGSFTLLDEWLKKPNPCKIHINCDTGLSRQGFFVNEIEKIFNTIFKYHGKNSIHHRKVTGLMTHFSNELDSKGHAESILLKQHNLFIKAKKICQKYKFYTKNNKFLYHCASTYSSNYALFFQHDYIRIGLGLFGLQNKPTASKPKTPSPSWPYNKTKPVLSWYSKIVQIKKIKKNSSIGYGGHYKPKTNIMIAILSTGYYHGYPKNISQYNYNALNDLDNNHSFNNTSSDFAHVLIAGYKCPIVGDISMNMMSVMLPMTALADKDIFFPYQRVTILGSEFLQCENAKNHLVSISVSDLSRWSGLIPYEILTNLKICIN